MVKAVSYMEKMANFSKLYYFDCDEALCQNGNMHAVTVNTRLMLPHSSEFYSAVKLLSSLLMCRVDHHPCIGSIKHKYNSDLNWMKTSINIYLHIPLCWKKTLISIGDILLGDVLTDRSGDVLVIHPGTFWFGDVLTGHPVNTLCSRLCSLF